MIKLGNELYAYLLNQRKNGTEPRCWGGYGGLIEKEVDFLDYSERKAIQVLLYVWGICDVYAVRWPSFNRQGGLYFFGDLDGNIIFPNFLVFHDFVKLEASNFVEMCKRGTWAGVA